ncbi:MAG: ATP-dependent RNA helicase DHX37/DHR1 [Bacillariaceae sp.]|jgi:ATP-dependent RNA helicase DHX37/DHR1
MRRSKSDPAKYARNYRSISQRRMTQFDDVDEDKEIKRLRAVLRQSEKHLKQVDEEESPTQTIDGEKKKRKRTIGHEEANNKKEGLLSDEFLLEQGHDAFGGDDNPLVVLPKKKKKKDKKAIVVHLTPEEIREARSLQKKTAKKLEQLESRAVKQKKRAGLYKKLQEDQQANAALQPLLLSSGTLSRKGTDTKKQALKKIINKERAGLSITKDEEDLLYPERTVIDELPPPSLKSPPIISSNSNKTSKNLESRVDADQNQTKEDQIKKENGNAAAKNDSAPQSAGIDFAAQMMASLTTIKDKNAEKQPAEEKEMKFSDFAQPKERYIPSNPTILKTAAMMGLQASTELDLNKLVLDVKRPAEVEKTRVDLPVTAMEFEIMDSIRNNDVTIICGETGSGKSTQIPAYLYEGGMSLCPSDPSKSYMIGITQPRRVAAVSTAKRVCFELGQGDGQSIKRSGGGGNLVSYKTRYESAGSGDSTRIQFMTDGILLSEIQSDLLLRKYSVIVLDESHERNLNTDVLIGLLSVALPLRKKAALEDPSIVPLKLVLMSATLRVEDFTKNARLFPTGPPAVVTVPGRTHPVTIHHSKVTELDDYGE